MTQKRDWVETSSGRKAYVVVRTAGQCFGCIGEVRGANGRTIAETRVVPYGMRHVAYGLAESLAATL